MKTSTISNPDSSFVVTVAQFFSCTGFNLSQTQLVVVPSALSPVEAVMAFRCGGQLVRVFDGAQDKIRPLALQAKVSPNESHSFILSRLTSASVVAVHDSSNRHRLRAGFGAATTPLATSCLDQNFGHQIDTDLPPAKEVARAIHAVSLAWSAMARIFAGSLSKPPAAIYSDAMALRAAQFRETSQV